MLNLSFINSNVSHKNSYFFSLAFENNIILPFPECDSKSYLNDHVPIKCETCDNSEYCSVSCRDKDSSHKLICNQLKKGGNLFDIHEMWKNMHFPPESSSILLIFKIFAMIKKNPQETVEKLGQFCNRSVNEDVSLCHKMLGEKFSQQLAALHSQVAQAFADEKDLEKFLTYDGFVSLLAIIGTNSQGIGTSSFADWVKNVSKVEISDAKQKELDNFIDSIYARFNDTVGEFLNNEGSGLYLTQSKINHSCLPNTEIVFPNSNHILQVVALRDINAEEEICISYLDECQLYRSRHSRRKYLLENYIFFCECEKCESQRNEADVTSDEEDDEEEMDTDD